MSPELRPVTPDDRGWLEDLYARVHGPALGLPAELAGPLLRMQVQAQDGSYRAQWPDAEHSVVVVDGRPAGQVRLRRGVDVWLVLDLSVDPALQGRGLGGAVLADILRAAPCPVQLSVMRGNPALRLYLRLGFELVAESPTHLTLRRGPTA